jgi:hypothetical protein
MRRRAPARPSPPTASAAAALACTPRDRLNQWARDHLRDLADAVPAMPVGERDADTWEPLIAVAEAAGAVRHRM